MLEVLLNPITVLVSLRCTQATRKLPLNVKATGPAIPVSGIVVKSKLNMGVLEPLVKIKKLS